MKRNTVMRLLVFFIGIPALGASAFIGGSHGLPVFGVLVITASALAAREAALFFPPDTRDYPGRWLVIPLVGATVPAIGYLSTLLDNRPFLDGIGASAVVVPAITVAAALTMAVQVLHRRDVDINRIVPVVSTHLFLLVYPGLFTWHAARLVSFEFNSQLILLFFLSIYLNDSMAWLFGRLFGGRRQRAGQAPPVAVSPNKSMVGFVAGFLASVIVIVGTGQIWPSVLPGSLWLHVLFGATIGLAAIVGDLVESGLKRSASVKDSGQVIPGRGGLLDSIDSPVFAAPFFYYGCVILYAL